MKIALGDYSFGEFFSKTIKRKKHISILNFGQLLSKKIYFKITSFSKSLSVFIESPVDPVPPIFTLYK